MTDEGIFDKWKAQFAGAKAAASSAVGAAKSTASGAMDAAKKAAGDIKNAASSAASDIKQKVDVAANDAKSSGIRQFTNTRFETTKKKIIQKLGPIASRLDTISNDQIFLDYDALVKNDAALQAEINREILMFINDVAKEANIRPRELVAVLKNEYENGTSDIYQFLGKLHRIDVLTKTPPSNVDLNIGPDIYARNIPAKKSNIPSPVIPPPTTPADTSGFTTTSPGRSRKVYKEEVEEKFQYRDFLT
jgi:hypothetical protein